MLTKNEIRDIISLQRKAERIREGLFIAEGVKIVAELLEHPGYTVKKLCATKAWLDENFPGGRLPEGFTEVSERELKKISSLSKPNEVLAVCSIPGFNLEAEDVKTGISIALDSLQDPGNLGTILRIADWFGIGQIICSEDTVDVYNSKVIQSSMGSFLRVKVCYTKLEDFLVSAGVPVLGAVLGGKNIYSAQLPENAILLMGNESKGISAGLQRLCTGLVGIPSFAKEGSGGAESLNVAVATAVICSEWLRQKNNFVIS